MNEITSTIISIIFAIIIVLIFYFSESAILKAIIGIMLLIILPFAVNSYLFDDDFSEWDGKHKVNWQNEIPNSKNVVFLDSVFTFKCDNSGLSAKTYVEINGKKAIFTLYNFDLVDGSNAKGLYKIRFQKTKRGYKSGKVKLVKFAGEDYFIGKYTQK